MVSVCIFLFFLSAICLTYQAPIYYPFTTSLTFTLKRDTLDIGLERFWKVLILTGSRKQAEVGRGSLEGAVKDIAEDIARAGLYCC
jgi:hypothetical protein